MATNIIQNIYHSLTYQYEIASQPIPLTEIYRIELYFKIIEQVKKQIPPTNKNIPQLHKWFSQLLTNTVYQSVDGNLTDGLLNVPSKSGLEIFYGNFRDKNIKSDDWGIIKLIEDAIPELKKFSNSNSTKIKYTFNQNKYLIDPSTMKTLHLTHVLNHLDNLYIHPQLYSKLKSRYTGPTNQFEDYLLCLVLRYRLIDTGSSTYTLDSMYKDQLQTYGINVDCISNPFVTYYDNYFGMWYDLDQYFGSKGITIPAQIEQGGYFFNVTYDKTLQNLSYDKIRVALKSSKPVVCILNIPKFKYSQLEDLIIKDKLYHMRKLKYEYFTDTLFLKQKLQPPYVSYLFYNTSYAVKMKIKLSDLHSIFESFSNYNLEMPVRNQIYDKY